MKDSILQLLLKSENTFISGEDMSATLGISRAAIWKHVTSLRQFGYGIESVTNKGYRLVSRPDLLSYLEVSRYLPDAITNSNYCYYETLSSTNDEAKRLAEAGAPEHTVVVCEDQTQGKGRLGTTFFSPKGTGIWLSIIIRPSYKHPKTALQFTNCLGNSLIKALKDFHIDAMLIEPNDVFINGQKISGILTEMSAELNRIHYLVLGIGIYVTGSPSIEMASGTLINRKELLGHLLQTFISEYKLLKQIN